MPTLTEELAGRVTIVDEILTGSLEDGERLTQVEFVGCTIRDTSWAGAEIRGVHFEGCTFERVDFSRVRLPDSLLDGCTFIGCKALATSWSMQRSRVIAPEPTTWIDCQLAMGSFTSLDLAGARFERCSLTDADFDDASLKGAVFDDSGLAGARFHESDLREADLRGARDYVIDVRTSTVEGLRVDTLGALGLLVPFGVVVD